MNRKILISAIGLLLAFTSAFALNFTPSYSFGVDAAYYPLSAAVPGKNHFAPLTGPFSGVEARVAGNASYTAPFLTGDGSNGLISGNNLTIDASLELTPVSVMSYGSVSLTPIAFLVFTAGGKIGTGWDFSPMGAQGIGVYNPVTTNYDSIAPFKNWFCELWLEGLFQFDLAAVVPGDWNHVVAMATYKLMYTKNTGAKDKEPWLWQTSGELFNGLNYYSSVIFGYQPQPVPVLNTVGVQFEFSGYYSNAQVDPSYAAWGGDFMTVSVNPVAILDLSKKDSLTVQLGFSSRRSFETLRSATDNSDFNLTYCGREWYFNRVAFSYSHQF
ncbi:MAG: hypothetical protein MJ183_08105 [Treponemataceae bacterium]|nr:hypothetical protein [Treponemataceae bacterium]